MKAELGTFSLQVYTFFTALKWTPWQQLPYLSAKTLTDRPNLTWPHLTHTDLSLTHSIASDLDCICMSAAVDSFSSLSLHYFVFALPCLSFFLFWWCVLEVMVITLTSKSYHSIQIMTHSQTSAMYVINHVLPVLYNVPMCYGEGEGRGFVPWEREKEREFMIWFPVYKVDDYMDR